MQVAPLKQAAPAQSSMFTEQSGPVQPFTHMQENPPMLLVQVAPFWQTEGRREHSSTSCSQKRPVERKKEKINVASMSSEYIYNLLEELDAKEADIIGESSGSEDEQIENNDYDSNSEIEVEDVGQDIDLTGELEEKKD
ncbi:hypothetical protein QE152_g6461 [Popillia japonica]|uniref:Uncharacterized protein n=1 Tax=Popillia japonica TaxID=7064 RepID=A0AAW1MHZ6_POPJA